MSHIKISYDDVHYLLKEHAKIIKNKYKELNKENIIHPTEQEYEKFLQDILSKATDVSQCLGIYIAGKNKNQRCKAVPHPGSKYCLKHRSQDLESQQILDAIRKTKLNNQ
jgi:hypothetical protein